MTDRLTKLIIHKMGDYKVTSLFHEITQIPYCDYLIKYDFITLHGRAITFNINVVPREVMKKTKGRRMPKEIAEAYRHAWEINIVQWDWEIIRTYL